MLEKEPQNIDKRCPRLGSAVSFDYCWDHAGTANLPCWKIIDCWWELFDIMGYIEQKLNKTEIDALIKAKPKPKVSSIIELINQAKQNK